jgi:riboflavin kinase/FMN adenylyltransferase
MPRVVAVGRFDGVHRGHQSLFQEARRVAPALTLTAYTFPPRGPSLLTADAKSRLLREHADEALTVPWELVRDLGPEEFLRDEIAARLDAAAVVVGPDHRFGRDRSGDLALLQRRAGPLGLAVHVVEPLRLGGAVVSAARIRDLVAAGDVGSAAALLGRPPWLVGSPTPGAKLARTLGYPTVNLDLAPELVRPRPGVYAAWAQWPNGAGEALFYIGERPTFPGMPPSAEVHLFVPPQGEVRGPVEVHLIQFLRPDQRFATAKELSQQIARDRARGEEILDGVPSPARLLG